jgi:hypothetical protein
MRKLAVFWTGILAALAVPAAAQPAIPFPYIQGPEFEGPNFVTREAPPDTASEEDEAEEGASAVADAACEAGDLAECTALGEAYLEGAGRPMNRFVGELLLRQACDGADATGCHKLGSWLTLSYSDIEPAWQVEARDYGIAMLGRSCALGNFDACSEQANAVTNGFGDAGGDPSAAMALRRAACARGSDRACRELATTLSESEDEAAQQESLDLLARQCRKGDVLACEQIEPLAAQNAALAREMAEIGCRTDSAGQCFALGQILFAADSGPPEQRTAALTQFDRACLLSSIFCLLPEQIRIRPALAQGCDRGVLNDCVALARIYAYGPSSPLYSPTEAASLLGNACVAGMTDTCHEAASVLLGDDIPESPESNARITLWYDTACDAGAQLDCIALGNHLLDTYTDADQRARGYAALMQVCDSGDIKICDKLDERAAGDPDAPLLAADSRFLPPLSEEEEAEIARQSERERAAGKRASVTCTSSTVTFRGVTYLDKKCSARRVMVVRGRLTREGEAPWQALLWRPALWNGRTLSPAERVECGGALVREGWILTAAHCVIDKKRRPLLTAGHQFRLGISDVRDRSDTGFAIRRVFAHPRYHEPSRTYDIALVQIDTTRRAQAAGSPDYKTIAIDRIPAKTRPFGEGMPVYVFGWGLTEFEGRASEQLKVARLELEAPAACERNTATDGNNYLKSSLLCAKADDRAQACDGDSGGPLVGYFSKGPMVIGVVSAGTECGRGGKATRYTRVAQMAEWINDVFAGRETPIASR